jgi:tetratricopeptide (TPR) repeat protein
MDNTIENILVENELVLFCGAGISAGKPSSLPGWFDTNKAIVEVLANRLESSLDRPGWLSNLVQLIDGERNAEHFPPDYQAQIIEEMCGDRYFRALQALDTDVINATHEGIATLVSAGAVKAIVTTNFDRLIERALDNHGIEYVVAYDDEGYLEMRDRLNSQDSPLLPIIKIHGCVSNHLSMIDTLKQRKKGRSLHLQHCLDAVQSHYWIYLGFSAADLETAPDYLGLVAGAKKSKGATFVVYPGKPELGNGAMALMDAYGKSGMTKVAHASDYLGELCQSLNIAAPEYVPEDDALGLTDFHKKLENWATQLPTAAAGLCLAAIMESVGQAESSVRILDRLVRKEIYDERDTDDFRSLQLHYGRLGAAWGRFIAVPDINGFDCNASVETKQSLLRLTGSNLEFAATSWLTCLWLWLSDGQQATVFAQNCLDKFQNEQWGKLSPKTDEEAVDAWLSAVQVCVLNSNNMTGNLVFSTADKALQFAERSGDVVRMARVIALKCLILAATNEDLPEIISQHEAIFNDAIRVGDGFALGMRNLALGRWYLGGGGLAMAQATDSSTVAEKSLECLADAIMYFNNQGMDPWIIYAHIQQAKAFADLHQIDDTQSCIDAASDGLNRFPIMTPHLHEAAGQIQRMWGREEEAVESFQIALKAAEECGLLFMRETLQQYVNQS